jgi:hypothetical protein
VGWFYHNMVLAELQWEYNLESLKYLNHRQIFNVGLKEAKDAVEAIASQSAAATSTFYAAPQNASSALFNLRRLGCLLILLGFLVFLAAMIGGVAFRLSGSYRQALAAAQSNPRVNEWLGQPIEPSWWPITGKRSCGDSCRANYTIPIYGSHGSGYITVKSATRT